MKIFCTGASGYIGGSIAATLAATGHQVCGLVRSTESADKVRTLGIEPPRLDGWSFGEAVGAVVRGAKPR